MTGLEFTILVVGLMIFFGVAMFVFGKFIGKRKLYQSYRYWSEQYGTLNSNVDFKLREWLYLP